MKQKAIPADLYVTASGARPRPPNSSVTAERNSNVEARGPNSSWVISLKLSSPSQVDAVGAHRAERNSARGPQFTSSERTASAPAASTNRTPTVWITFT